MAKHSDRRDQRLVYDSSQILLTIQSLIIVCLERQAITPSIQLVKALTTA